jgi:hypothetical protein
MLRAVRGDKVERPPVWMMRQAGRYQKVYQELCKKHPTFRERSERVDLAVSISVARKMDWVRGTRARLRSHSGAPPLRACIMIYKICRAGALCYTP